MKLTVPLVILIIFSPLSIHSQERTCGQARESKGEDAPFYLTIEDTFIVHRDHLAIHLRRELSTRRMRYGGNQFRELSGINRILIHDDVNGRSYLLFSAFFGEDYRFDDVQCSIIIGSRALTFGDCDHPDLDIRTNFSISLEGILAERCDGRPMIY